MFVVREVCTILHVSVYHSSPVDLGGVSLLSKYIYDVVT